MDQQPGLFDFGDKWIGIFIVVGGKSVEFDEGKSGEDAFDGFVVDSEAARKTVENGLRRLIADGDQLPDKRIDIELRV